jgi:hypothetical protein
VHQRVPETRFISLGRPNLLFFSSIIEPSRTRLFKSCFRLFPCFLSRERMATSSLGAMGFFSCLKILRMISFVSSCWLLFFLISFSNMEFSYIAKRTYCWFWDYFDATFQVLSSSANGEDTYDSYGLPFEAPEERSMAERQGFEPWVPFIAGHSLSRRAPSAYSVTSPDYTVYFFSPEKSMPTARWIPSLLFR